jgi:hypothetical protein
MRTRDNVPVGVDNNSSEGAALPFAHAIDCLSYSNVHQLVV